MHRRDEFRAAPDRVDKMTARVADKKIRLRAGSADPTGEEGGRLTAALAKPVTGDLSRRLRCHAAVLRSRDEARSGHQSGREAQRGSGLLDTGITKTRQSHLYRATPIQPRARMHLSICRPITRSTNSLASLFIRA
jgi:hypothetical protein